MKTSKFLKDCGMCDGTGQDGFNNFADKHPSRDEVFDCDYCEDGKVIDEEALDVAIYDANDMIEGMIARIRVTSDNIKLCAKLECHNLVARYKNTLNTQARALARLEMYKANLQSLIA